MRILELDVTLAAVDPPVARKLLVPSHLPLPTVGDVVMSAMGWDSRIWYEFVRDDVHYVDNRYGDCDPEEGLVFSEDMVLSDILSRPGDRIDLEVDRSDEWLHEIVVRQVRKPRSGFAYPTCIAGENAFVKGADVPPAVRREISLSRLPVAGPSAYPRVRILRGRGDALCAGPVHLVILAGVMQALVHLSEELPAPPGTALSAAPEGSSLPCTEWYSHISWWLP